MKKRIGALLMLASMLAPAWARSAARVNLFSKDDRLLCESDIRALCATAGRGDVQACLIAHADEVRDSHCKAIVDSAKAAVAGIIQTCRFDIDTKCVGLDLGSGVLECLAGRRADLMGSCRSSI